MEKKDGDEGDEEKDIIECGVLKRQSKSAAWQE